MKPKHRIFQPGNIADVEVATLALINAPSGNYLAQRTKMSRAMVYYRLRKAGLRLWDIRNGASPIQREVERRVRTFVGNYVYKDILPRFQP